MTSVSPKSHQEGSIRRSKNRYLVSNWGIVGNLKKQAKAALLDFLKNHHSHSYWWCFHWCPSIRDNAFLIPASAAASDIGLTGAHNYTCNCKHSLSNHYSVGHFNLTQNNTLNRGTQKLQENWNIRWMNGSLLISQNLFTFCLPTKIIIC